MSESEVDEHEIVPGGVYRKKPKGASEPTEKFGVMTNLFRHGQATKGLLQDDGGRVPFQRNRNGGGNMHELELISRPVPLSLYSVLLSLAPIVADLLELVRDHRERKAKSK